MKRVYSPSFLILFLLQYYRDPVSFLPEIVHLASLLRSSQMTLSWVMCDGQQRRCSLPASWTVELTFSDPE